jgi:hypothetical protein
MNSGTRRKASAAALGLVLGMTLWATPVTAQEPVLDLTCGPSADGPDAPNGTHVVTAVASYRCGTIRPSIGIAACLLYNGAPVNCDQDARLNDDEASVELSFPCLPGTWTLAGVGVASGAPPGLPLGIVVQLNCDPLRP